jgi:hypothetical protein
MRLAGEHVLELRAYLMNTVSYHANGHSITTSRTRACCEERERSGPVTTLQACVKVSKIRGSLNARKASFNIIRCISKGVRGYAAITRRATREQTNDDQAL